MPDLSPAQVAAELAVSRATVYRQWKSIGGYKVGKLLRFPVDFRERIYAIQDGGRTLAGIEDDSRSAEDQTVPVYERGQEMGISADGGSVVRSKDPHRHGIGMGK